MTTLTPYRDSILQGLEVAEQQLQALSVTAAGHHEREMSMGVLRAALVPLADMLDREMPYAKAQEALEGAIANLVISHCLNFEHGDNRHAGAAAVRLLANVRDLAQRRLRANQPAIHVYSPVPHPTTTGRA